MQVGQEKLDILANIAQYLSNGQCSVWNLYISHTSGNIHYLRYHVYTRIGKRMLLVISTVFSKMKDLSRSQAVKYNVGLNVVTSLKTVPDRVLLLETTNSNKKWYMACRIEAIQMTLGDLHCHSRTASLLKCDFSQRCATVDKISTDTARLVVSLMSFSCLPSWQCTNCTGA